jgi:hypothetical protein
VFLFIPIFILIGALFMGYSVIRAGTLAMGAAAVVSWLTPYRMGVKEILFALEISTKMTLQLVAVCAAAGIIVGVIALTGLGTRFSSLLLGLAENNQIIALFFAMVVSIVLGMGMPTTAAYAVAASVIAPGLISMGIDMLTAHFFIFYFAVMSAITPPVALAAYAGAAIAQSDPMKTSVCGALHVLFIARTADAGQHGRHHPCRDRGIAGCLPAVIGGAGVVLRQPQHRAAHRAGPGGLGDDRLGLPDRCHRAGHCGGDLGGAEKDGQVRHHRPRRRLRPAAALNAGAAPFPGTRVT